MNSIDGWSVWLAIGGAAAVTYAFRAGGLALADRLPSGGPVGRALNALPGALLIALAAPAVLDGGWIGLAAAGAAAGLLAVGGNVLLAISAAMALAVLLRAVI